MGVRKTGVEEGGRKMGVEGGCEDEYKKYN